MQELPANQSRLPASWRPRSLLEYDGPPRAEPDKLGGLIYSDSLGIVSGEPGSGKSMISMAIAAENVKQEKTTFFWDFERPGHLLLERLRAAGVSDDEIERFVRYMHPVEYAKSSLIPAVLEEAGEADTIVIDSYDSVLTILGFAGKANNPNEILEQFHIEVLERIRETKALVILIDHLAKSKESRGIYSVGGYRKLGRAEWHLGVDVMRPFHRGGIGKLKLYVHKDNHGFLPRLGHPVFELRSHELTGALSWTVQMPVASEDGWRPTILMEKASRWLEKLDEPVAQTAIVSDLKGNKQALVEALDVLVDEEFIELTQGSRGAKMFRSLKPFRREEDEAEIPAAESESVAAPENEEFPF